MKEKNTKKLTDKDILQIFKGDHKAAETLRKDLDSKIAKWKAEYNGDKYGNEEKGKSEIVSRDIKKQSEWQHASLIDPFVSSPNIMKAYPITWEDKPASRQSEIILNTQFCRQFDRYSFMTKAVKVLDQEGTAIIQTGWEYEEEEREVTKPIMMTHPYTGEQIQVAEKTVMETVTTVNKPTAKVCRNEDVFIDPTCQDNLDNAQFVIYRYETDYSSLKQDGRYKNLKNLVKAKDSTNTWDSDYENEDDTEFEFKDEARKKILVYEYWGNFDRNGDGVAEPVVCAWVDQTIIRMEDNPFPDGKPPFIAVPFNSVPFSLYGEPNAELISDNQKIKTAMYRNIIDNMAQSNNNQKGIKKGALDDTNKKRFLSNKNFEYNGTQADFFTGKFNALPGAVYDVLGLMNNEVESITGAKSFSEGITGNSLGSTATGARGALDATATRRLNLVRNISENLVKPLLRKWMAYNAEFLDEGQVIRYTNDEFIEINKDDLSGKIDIDIQVSTAEDNSAKAQELAFMMQTLGNSMDHGMRSMLMAEIATLHRMPDLAKKIEEYQPQPDPMQVQMAQLEMAKLQAEIANEQAKGQENRVDVQLKQAKTQTELAKAADLNETADMKALQFLEKESGVDHAKEMEKKDFDRIAKLDTEALKAMSKQ